MPTYISLVQFTDKGIQAAKETTQRVVDWSTKVQSMGVRINQMYWTLGQYDQVCIFDAPNDETAPVFCWRRTCWATSARGQCALSQPPRWRESCPRCPDLLEGGAAAGRRYVARKRNARPLRIEYEETLITSSAGVITLATATV